MPELKPCPFCGGKARYGYAGAKHIVICTRCGVRAPAEGGEENAENAVKAWNTRPDNWISVEERLPEDGDVILVYTHDRCYDVGTYTVPDHENEGGFSTPFGGYAKDGDFITHWMPLPDAPKGDE